MSKRRLRSFYLPFCIMLLFRLASPAETVRFVVLGDSQLMRRAQFERMIHEVNLLKPDFVTNTGDMIHGYTDDKEQIRAEWRMYLKQIEPLTMPFFPVPGNHDVGTPEAHEIYAEVWGENRYFYSHAHGSVFCIVLDSYHAGVRDRLLPEHRVWLQNTLDDYARQNGGIGSDQLNRKSIFIFVHSPFWRYLPEQEEGHADWLAVEEFLGNYPVRMVIAGNTDRHHEYMWENRNGIDHVVLTSTGNFPHDNERAGYFHSFLHLTVSDGEVRTAVIKPGSILPMDTVRPDERQPAARHGLSDGIIRIPFWEDGKPLDIQIAVPIENTLDQTRTVHLHWTIPRDATVSVQPNEIWLDLEPGQLSRPRFRLTSPVAPPQSRMPSVRVTTSSTLRSGLVSRDWEKRYRDEHRRADAGETIPVTQIPLEKEYTFTATHTLFVPPVFRAARMNGTIVIDGIIDEEAWNRAGVLDRFYLQGTVDPAPFQTEIRALYDEKHLYLSAWMEEPHPDRLKADAHGEIPLTWNDDDIEFFFDPLQTALDHTRIFENSAGTRFNGKPIGTPDRYAPMEYESAIHIGEDFWSIELRIPWSDIVDAAPPASGDAWGFNVRRHRQQSQPSLFYWSVDEYDQGRYGRLVFQ